MDNNKEQKLKDIGYKIYKTCGLCKHAKFNDGSQFGVCTLFKYRHLKHTGEERELSVHVSGGCSSFTLNTDKEVYLHAYKQFL